MNHRSTRPPPPNNDAIRASLFGNQVPSQPTTSSSSSSSMLPRNGTRPGPAYGVNKKDGLYQEQSENLFEQQNNDMISSLNEKVAAMKKISIDIGEEIKSQNKFLDGMDEDMSGAQGFMKGTINKLQQMINTGGSKHMWYLVAFIFVFFIIIWWMIR